MIDYTKILNDKYPGSEWVIHGDDYEGLIWLSDTPKPSKATLDNLWDEVKENIALKEQEKTTAKAELMERLGITEEEVKLLLS